MNPPARILFPIAVDPRALLDFNDPAHKQTHAVAAEFVRQYGILSYGPGDKQALYGAVSELSGRAQQLWASVMEYLKVCRRTDEQSRTSSLPDFLQDLAMLENSADEVRLAIIATSAATITQTTQPASNTTEHVTLPDIDESRAVTDASEIGTFPLRALRSEIAEQLVKPLAARSTHVKVMDPHILEKLITDAKNPSPLPNVEWLLGVLGAAMLPDSTISIVGTLQGRWDPRNRADAETRIDRFLEHALRTRATPITVKVRLVQAAKTPVKNRFLWFNCGCSFDVLHNFAPLIHEELKEELRLIRQDEATAEQTRRLAEEYESFNLAGSLVSVTKLLGGNTSTSSSAIPRPPSDPNPPPRASTLGGGVRPRPPGRPHPHPSRPRSGHQ